MGIRLITRSSFRTWQDPQGESETWQDPQGVKRVPPKVATNPEGATNFAKSLLEVGRMGRAWQSCRQEWLDALCPAVSLKFSSGLFCLLATCLLASSMFHSWILRNAQLEFVFKFEF